MGKLIKPDGTVTTVYPRDGKEFSLEELQGLVAGYIEHVLTRTGKHMFINEEGRLQNLQLNPIATFLYRCYSPATGNAIVGNALVCEEGETS